MGNSDRPVSAQIIYNDGAIELWHADALNPKHVKTVMGERKASCSIFDAPYSEKTHVGHANGKLTADRAAAFAAAHAGEPTPESRYSARKSEAGESGRRDINYEHFDEAKIKAFCDTWCPITEGWFFSITDDVLAPIWGSEFERHELYKFCPLPLVETGSRVRMTGDGPSNWTCWCVPARPANREYASWGTLRGAYVQAGERKINSRDGSTRVVGGKPLKSMCDIVNDYSRKDDLVVDQFVGGGTTAVACKINGRRCIGIDLNLEHLKLAVVTLSNIKEQITLLW
jgi:hypothetical protein